jgi:hypothetical protein
VVVDVGFPPVLLGLVLVGDVHVLHLGMVVLVGMGRQEMHPVLPSMEVVGDVIVLVAVVEGVVVMATSRLRDHRALLPSPVVSHSRQAARRVSQTGAR